MDKITEAEQVFMNRDRMSREEAREHRKSIREEIMDVIDNGGSYSEVEDLLCDEMLEMDYLFDFI